MAEDSVLLSFSNLIKQDSDRRGPVASLLGRTIRRIRLEVEMSQQELADRLGITKSYVSRIENGGVDISVKELVRIFQVGLEREVNLYLKDLPDN